MTQAGELTAEVYGYIRDGDYESAVNILEVRNVEAEITFSKVIVYFFLYLSP